LPPVLIFMVLIASNEKIMGRYRNSRLYNVVAWAFTVVIIALTLLLLVSSLAPGYLDQVVQRFIN